LTNMKTCLFLGLVGSVLSYQHPAPYNPAPYNPYPLLASSYRPVAPSYPQNPYAGLNLAALDWLRLIPQHQNLITPSVRLPVDNGFRGILPAPGNPIDPTDVANAPLVTFQGTGSGQTEGTGVTGFIGQGQAQVAGTGAGLFFGSEGDASFTGRGNVNAITTPFGTVGTFIGNGAASVDGNGGLIAAGTGATNFAGTGFGFNQLFGNQQIQGLGNVRIMTPPNTRFGRTSLFSPPTAQSQTLFQPLNQFANDALLATQNLLVQSLANYNTLQQNSIQTTQQVINGLFNSYRNTNTFKPGGPNVVAVAGPKNSKF